jgi:cytochrome c oxidase subunit 2
MPDTTHSYEHVRAVYFPLAVAVFALVLLVLIALVIRGARRRAEPARRSSATAFEFAYAGVLAAVAAALIVITFREEAPIDRTVAHPSLRIGVSAAQWSWRFSYPNGVTVAAVSTWHPAMALVPTGVEIEFVGSSRDVIHGFWVPELHLQRQLLPGYTTRFDLRVNHPGRYQGTCSVFCGNQHGEMQFALLAVRPRQFEQWLRARAEVGARNLSGTSVRG